MIFSQLNDTACKTYLIACEKTREAILVDPVLERVDTYLQNVKEQGLLLKYVLDTHVHADHISGGAAVRDRTSVDYIMHELSASACVNLRVHEGDELMVGEVPIRFLHTPGHTQDSLSLLFKDRILTGDFLFIGEGGAGRTDLPGGDAGEHWDSLQKLKELPDSMLVYPAHDYHGRDESTLGAERKQNPRLQTRTREEYVEWLDGFRLGPADWMADVVKANYSCAQDPRAVWIPVDQPSCEVKGTLGNVNTEKVRSISAQALHQEVSDGLAPMMIDVRQEEEFNDELGHIEGSVLIPIGELPKRLGELDGAEDRKIVTVCRTGGRSATAAAILSVAGIKNVYSLEGGIKRWQQLNYASSRSQPESAKGGNAVQTGESQR